MEIEFKGNLLSLWMPCSDKHLPEIGVFIPTKFSISKTIASDAGPFDIPPDTGALGIYETDKKTIELNLIEEPLELACDVRLLDTRHGLTMYLKWKLSPNKPQAVSSEQFLSMHSKTMIKILNNMFYKQDFFLFGYCDFHAQKVVRTVLMPSNEFSVISVLATQASELIDAGRTYAKDFDLVNARQEAMDYVDKHQSVIRISPEKTYDPDPL